MHHELLAFDNDEALAAAAAAFVCERAQRCVDEHGAFHIAVSGGTTPWAMFAALTTLDVPWKNVVIYQVDERITPPDDPARNLGHLRAALGDAEAVVRPMPVNDSDLEVAATTYASALPDRFDLVHLGLGPDGHTASLVPGDPVLEITDQLVGLTGNYQGHPRMTLTYPALARADQILWLVAGADKREPLAQLLGGDSSIPAGRVTAGASLVMADQRAVA